LPDIDFTQVMTTWTKQKGHPVLHMQVLNKTHVKVKQNRYVLDSTVPVESLKE